MRVIETDYLVVGAGASGLAFTDALINRADVDVVIVDRRARPGGHWLDAYPFVRLHQPSATYGVDSRELGTGRIDTSGPNAGYYELATGVEVVGYFGRVLDEDLLTSGRVRFYPATDYLGADGDGHRLRSVVSGAVTTVKVRKKLVDGTYLQPTIPSRHKPSFEIGDGVRFVSPNALADLADGGARYTIIGSGKTAMDTCGWLIEGGVAPDAIRWIKPREPLMVNRAFTQPRELVASFMQLQASLVQAAAEARVPTDVADSLAASDVLVRVHSDVEPTTFRGGTISVSEVERIRQVEHVVRMGYVQRIDSDRVILRDGTIDALRGEVFVDCSARGVPTVDARPVFEPGRITLQILTLGNVPYGAAIVGVLEALYDDDAMKERMCPSLPFDGALAGFARIVRNALAGGAARSREPEFSAWNAGSRMNPTRGAQDRTDDPVIAKALETIAANTGPALENLARLATAAT